MVCYFKIFIILISRYFMIQGYLRNWENTKYIDINISTLLKIVMGIVYSIFHDLRNKILIFNNSMAKIEICRPDVLH